jgi:hypothetical protein
MTTDEGVVRRLLDDYAHGDGARLSVSAPASNGGDGAAEHVAEVPSESGPRAVPIHLVYDGLRIDAEFHASSHAVTIRSGPLRGRRFRTPSGAAVAVIQRLNPSVSPNRNGWITWVVDESGEFLQSIRHK